MKITPENIDKESYYNLCKLCDITGYANPLRAIKQTGETIEVEKDENGNIINHEDRNL